MPLLLGVQTCALDRKSTRLNSSHTIISYAVFCLKKIIGKPTVLILLTGCPPLPSSPPSPAPASYPSLSSERLSFEHAVFFLKDTAATESHTLPLLDTFPG